MSNYDLAPNNWDILSNDGTNISAYNRITKQTFTGTTADFNVLTSKVLSTDNDYVEPNFNKITQVSSLSGVWQDAFAGLSYAAGSATNTELTNRGLWSIYKDVGGMQMTLTPGQLAVNMGTTSNAELILLSKPISSIPISLTAVLNISQRIVNNEIRIGIIEVDPKTGKPIVNPNLTGFYRNSATILFDGTTNTTCKTEVVADNNNAVKILTSGAISASSSDMEYTIDYRPDDIIFNQIAPDTTAARTFGGRMSSMMPNPSKAYAVALWFKNLGTAPASATTVSVKKILLQDIQEMIAEVNGGRGYQNAATAIPIVVTGGSTGLANITLVNSSNGGSVAKINSAASNNLTLIKGSAGKIGGGILANNSASWAYLRLFNSASTGAVTMGTTSPAVIIPIGPGASISIGSIVNIFGRYFSTGIVYAITAGASDLDNTALAAANTVVGYVEYI